MLPTPPSITPTPARYLRPCRAAPAAVLENPAIARLKALELPSPGKRARESESSVDSVSSGGGGVEALCSEGMPTPVSPPSPTEMTPPPLAPQRLRPMSSPVKRGLSFAPAALAAKMALRLRPMSSPVKRRPPAVESPTKRARASFVVDNLDTVLKELAPPRPPASQPPKRRKPLRDVLPSPSSTRPSPSLAPHGMRVATSSSAPSAVPAWADEYGDGAALVEPPKVRRPPMMKPLPPLLKVKPSSSLDLAAAGELTKQELKQRHLMYRVFQLHGAWKQRSDLAPGAAFSSVLALEYPFASREEIAYMATFVAKRDAALAEYRRLEQSREKQAQLSELFAAVDVDGNGTLCLGEVLQLAGLANLDRTAVTSAFERRAVAKAGAAEAELDPTSFGELMSDLDAEGELEGVDLHSLGPVLARAKAAKASASSEDGGEAKAWRRDSLLVFDDGVKQLWRLVPGGRVMVRRDLATRGGTRAARPSLVRAAIGVLA